MKKIILASTVLFILAGCGGGGSSSSGGTTSSSGNFANNNSPTGLPSTPPGSGPVSLRVLDLVNKLLPGRGKFDSSQIRPLVVDPTLNAGILPQISADGRYIAFLSQSPDLVEGDTNTLSDIFVRDMNTATTVRVNLLDNAAQTPAGVGEYSFSSDLQWVGFWISSNDGPPPYWYLKNVLTGQNFSGRGFLEATSPDGTKVCYWTGGGGPPGRLHVFDRVTNQTLDITPAANGDSIGGRFSSDGSLLYFYSEASNLVAGDTNGVGDVFSYRFSDGLFSRVSVLPGGGQLNGRSLTGRESHDGRYYVFPSQASNIVAGDTNGVDDVFVKDIATGQLTLVSRAMGGAVANGDSLFPTISGDGKLIVFSSNASNLVASDTNGVNDVFLYNRETNTLLGRVSLTDENKEARGGNNASRNCEISGDGNWIVFNSDAENMIKKVKLGGYTNLFRTNAVVPDLYTPPGPHANAFQYNLTGDANLSLSTFDVSGSPTVRGEVLPTGQPNTVHAEIILPGTTRGQRLELRLQVPPPDTISVGDQIELPTGTTTFLYGEFPSNGQGTAYNYISGNSGLLTIVSYTPGPGSGATIGIRVDDWEMVPDSLSPQSQGSFLFNGTITIQIP